MNYLGIVEHRVLDIVHAYGTIIAYVLIIYTHLYVYILTDCLEKPKKHINPSRPESDRQRDQENSYGGHSQQFGRS
jgi:hypothetical protein